MRGAVVAITPLIVACGRFGFGGPGDAADAPGTEADAFACVAPSFCDDFDTGPLGATWSGFSTNALGALAFSSSAASPPNSLRATIAAAPAAVDRQALLIETIPAMQSIRCSFDLAIEQTSTSERARFVSLFVNNPIWSGYELNVWILNDGTTLLEEWGIYASDGTSFITGNPGAPLYVQDRPWRRIDFEVDYAGSALLFADGSPIAGITMTNQTPVGESFFLGLRSDGTGAWAVAIDNLVCTPVLL